MSSQSRFRSSSSNQLTVRPLRLVTVGKRLFASAGAGPWLWNSLPDGITPALSLTMFRQKLKTHSFLQTLLCHLFLVVLAMVVLAVILT